MAGLRALIAARKQYEEYHYLFNRGIASIYYRDQQDERLSSGGFTARSSNNVMKRGIQRLLDLEQFAYESAFGADPDRAERYMQSYQHTKHEYHDSELATGDQAWYQARRLDIVSNVLYQKWLDQRAVGFKTYPAFALATAAKAIIELVCCYRGASAMLATLTNLEPPPRETCLTIKQQPWYDESESFLAQIFQYPDMLAWTEFLLLRYGDVVKGAQELAQTETPAFLPDDPLNMTRGAIAQETRIELALNDLAAGLGRADALARQYGIGQKRFRQLAKKRGILKSRGGNRKLRG
jgi:hypothetical protein